MVFDDLKRDKINVRFSLGGEVVSHIEQILNKLAYIAKTVVSAQDTVAIVMCRLYEGLESVYSLQSCLYLPPVDAI